MLAAISKQIFSEATRLIAPTKMLPLEMRKIEIIRSTCANYVMYEWRLEID